MSTDKKLFVKDTTQSVVLGHGNTRPEHRNGEQAEINVFVRAYAHTCEPHKRLGCAACIGGVCPGFTCARASHKSLRLWLLKLELCAEDCMTRIPAPYHPCRPLRTSLQVWSESTCELLFAITTVIEYKQKSTDARIVTKTHSSKILVYPELLLVFTAKKNVEDTTQSIVLGHGNTRPEHRNGQQAGMNIFVPAYAYMCEQNQKLSCVACFNGTCPDFTRAPHHT